MSSIVENLISSLPQVSDDYATNIRLPTQKLSELGNELRAKGDVFLPFKEWHALEGKSLVAIDGGRASQQLAGGDLVVVGATLGDGAKSVPMYGENVISEAYATVVAHTSKVESEFAGRMMSTLELRVLSLAKTNYTIIDGAYLGNVSEVLFGLASDNKPLIDTILDYNKDGRIEDAMQKILYPKRDNSSGILAVSKSDSSFVYSKQLLGEHSELASLVSDRNLASYFLQPGEFLVPRNLQSNPALIKTLNMKSKDLSDEVKKVVTGKSGLLTRMGTETTEEGILWTTYFKPTRWTALDRAIKIEFVFYPSAHGKTVNEHAAELVEVVNDDILNNSILEPWSQYLADRRAKEVGLGIDIVKNHLLNNVESSAEAQGLIRGYRT